MSTHEFMPHFGTMPVINLHRSVRAAKHPSQLPESWGSTEFHDAPRVQQKFLVKPRSQNDENAQPATNSGGNESIVCKLPIFGLACLAGKATDDFFKAVADGLRLSWDCFKQGITAIFTANWDYFRSEGWQDCEPGFMTMLGICLVIGALVLLAVFGVGYFGATTVFDSFQIVWEIFSGVFNFVYAWLKDLARFLWSIGVWAIELAWSVFEWLADITHSHPALWAANLVTALVWAAIELVTQTVRAEVWFMQTTGYRVYRVLNTPVQLLLDLLEAMGGSGLAWVAKLALLPLESLEFVLAFIIGSIIDGISSLFSKAKPPTGVEPILTR